MLQRNALFSLAVLVAMTIAAASAQGRRSVVLEVGLPNGATPQLRILDGGMGTVSTPQLGKFGFVPTVKDGAVAVDVFDLDRTPDQRIAEVEATVGGDAVETNTKPQFTIRAVRVIAE
jgi:hypothetical protein